MRRHQYHEFSGRHSAAAIGLSLAMGLYGVVAAGQAPSPAQDRSAPTEARQVATHHWKIEEFDKELKQLDGNRSFEQGRKAFDEALCAVCHRIEERGGDLGPNLSKPEKQRTRRELLQEILEPSRNIEPKYCTQAVVTVEGKVFAGVITEQSDQQVTIRCRPLGEGASHTILRSNIDSIEQLDISMMPDELLSRLTKDEVLDLLAYVESKGDPKSRLFRQP